MITDLSRAEILGIDLDKPQFVNEKGFKFWLDESSTSYAQKVCELTRVEVCIVLEPDGKWTRLIVDDGKPVYEAQGVEAIGVRLDIMKLLRITK